MSDKLIDIAKECGAEEFTDHIDIPVEVAYVFTPDELRATVEQVAGPLVEALEMVANRPNGMWYGIDDKVLEALAAYNEIMGDKK